MTLGDLYLSIDGRISRSTFWLKYALPVFVVNFVVGMISAATGAGHMLLTILSIFLIWPNVAVSLKRWHDRDKSAWWLLMSTIPIVGWIWGLIELGFLRGIDGPNRFGPDPLA